MFKTIQLLPIVALGFLCAMNDDARAECSDLLNRCKNTKPACHGIEANLIGPYGSWRDDCTKNYSTLTGKKVPESEALQSACNSTIAEIQKYGSCPSTAPKKGA